MSYHQRKNESAFVEKDVVKKELTTRYEAKEILDDIEEARPALKGEFQLTQQLHEWMTARAQAFVRLTHGRLIECLADELEAIVADREDLDKPPVGIDLKGVQLRREVQAALEKDPEMIAQREAQKEAEKERARELIKAKRVAREAAGSESE